MGIEDFPTNENPPKEGTEIVNGEEKIKDEVGEAKNETGKETELTEEEAEQKKEEIIVLCEEADEKLEQEAEKLPEDKRKVFEGFAENVKKGFKKAGRFLEENWGTLSAGGLTSIAFGAVYKTAYESGGFYEHPVEAAIILGIFSGMTIGVNLLERVEKKNRR